MSRPPIGLLVGRHPVVVPAPARSVVAEVRQALIASFDETGERMTGYPEHDLTRPLALWPRLLLQPNTRTLRQIVGHRVLRPLRRSGLKRRQEDHLLRTVMVWLCYGSDVAHKVWTMDPAAFPDDVREGLGL